MAVSSLIIKLDVILNHKTYTSSGSKQPKTEGSGKYGNGFDIYDALLAIGYIERMKLSYIITRIILLPSVIHLFSSREVGRQFICDSTHVHEKSQTKTYLL